MGVSRHPAFPAPSYFDEGRLIEKLGRSAPRERDLTSRSAVMPRFKRGTQCSRGVALRHAQLWNTGSPGQAGRRQGRGCYLITESVRRVGKAAACPPFGARTEWWARRDAPLPTLRALDFIPL